MNFEVANFVTVFRTGRTIDLDWVANALAEAGIPFQRREETSGGLQLAMPAAPAGGPGQWWSILVPESLRSRARAVLDDLPIEPMTTPDVWNFQPKPGVKLGWQIYSWLVLVGLACGGLLWLVELLGIWK